MMIIIIMMMILELFCSLRKATGTLSLTPNFIACKWVVTYLNCTMNLVMVYAANMVKEVTVCSVREMQDHLLTLDLKI